MSGVGDKLQSYLSSGKAHDGDGSDHIGLIDGIRSSKLSSWFSQRRDQPVDDTANGWFSQAQQDPCFPSLSKKQRVLGFVGCLLMGTFCFSLASLYIPMLILKGRKFAMLYSLGSLFVIASFSFIWGPVHHIKHLCSAERLPFTAAYFGTMFGTIYFSMWAHSTSFTIVFAVLQILALVWFVVSYIPGGQTGLKFFTRVFYGAASKTVKTALPV